MEPGNPLISRLQQQRGRIQGMLSPGLRGQPGERLSPVAADFAGRKFKLAAQQMRALDPRRLGPAQPADLPPLSREVPAKFQNPQQLIHLRPGVPGGKNIWSSLETPLPGAPAARPEPPADEPGVLRQGSVIQRMNTLPKPGQTLEAFRQQIQSQAQPAKAPRPASEKKPAVPANARLFSRVQEITAGQKPAEPQAEEPLSTPLADLPAAQSMPNDRPAPAAPPPARPEAPRPPETSARAEPPTAPPSAAPQAAASSAPSSGVVQRQPDESIPAQPLARQRPTPPAESPTVVQAPQATPARPEAPRPPASAPAEQALPVEPAPAPAEPAPDRSAAPQEPPTLLQADQPAEMPLAARPAAPQAAPVSESEAPARAQESPAAGLKQALPAKPAKPAQAADPLGAQRPMVAQAAPRAPQLEPVKPAAQPASPQVDSAPSALAAEQPLPVPPAAPLAGEALQPGLPAAAQMPLRQRFDYRKSAPAALRALEPEKVKPAAQPPLLRASEPPRLALAKAQPAPAPVSETLPADLLAFMPAPAPGQPPLQARVESAPTPRPSAASAPLPMPVAASPAARRESPAQPQTQPAAQITALRPAQKPHPSAAPSPVNGANVVQRMWDEHEELRSAGGESSPGQSGAQSAPAASTDLRALAEDVFPYVKRILENEAHRSSGHLR